ncbi:hypothetical protein TELCIR_12305 [Teladorsagia circumcincta]|uniref:Uncharacterized protein n=1 Tax=Teladorsagia circumcincta TaxID=45464 RepID=A0A2G9U6X1_TELCI|nr:hypothetical protein TELCIR_12305 [Teladorsagia circumcincta]
MPAFATAAKEDFNDYIEQAVEKKGEEEKKELMRYTQLLEQSAGRAKYRGCCGEPADGVVIASCTVRMRSALSGQQ